MPGKKNVLKEERLIFIIVFSLRSAASIASCLRQWKPVADDSALHDSRMYQRKEWAHSVLFKGILTDPSPTVRLHLLNNNSDMKTSD